MLRAACLDGVAGSTACLSLLPFEKHAAHLTSLLPCCINNLPGSATPILPHACCINMLCTTSSRHFVRQEVGDGRQAAQAFLVGDRHGSVAARRRFALSPTTSSCHSAISLDCLCTCRHSATCALLPTSAGCRYYPSPTLSITIQRFLPAMPPSPGLLCGCLLPSHLPVCSPQAAASDSSLFILFFISGVGIWTGAWTGRTERTEKKTEHHRHAQAWKNSSGGRQATHAPILHPTSLPSLHLPLLLFMQHYCILALRQTFSLDTPIPKTFLFVPSLQHTYLHSMQVEFGGFCGICLWHLVPLQKA